MSTSHAAASDVHLPRSKRGCSVSPSPSRKRLSRRKSKRDKRKSPIKAEVKDGNEHVQLSSQVDTDTFCVPPEKHESEEEKYKDKVAPIENKFWDEVEMKHHGLVDDHAHHKDIAPPEKPEVSTDQPSNQTSETNQNIHIPFDEIELKHGGFVDNHCQHLTKKELEDDHGEDNYSKHVQFEAAALTDDLSESENRPINSKQYRKELRVESQVETVDVVRNETDNYEAETVSHTPWDECEMKDHGLVDKQGHHKSLPEDDIQLHREGKIDEHGHHNDLNQAQPMRYRPFDEVAMKQSGYVDNRCHHMTDAELDEQSASPSGGHIAIKSNISTQSPASSIEYQQSDKMPESYVSTATLTDETKQKNQAKQERTPNVDFTKPAKLSSDVNARKKTKKRMRKVVYKLKIQGAVNVTERTQTKANLHDTNA